MVSEEVSIGRSVTGDDVADLLYVSSTIQIDSGQVTSRNRISH